MRGEVRQRGGSGLLTRGSGEAPTLLLRGFFALTSVYIHMGAVFKPMLAKTSVGVNFTVGVRS